MSKEDICPICKTKEDSQWINCDACKIWLHTACLEIIEVEKIDKFYCPSCTETHGPTTFKSNQQRKSGRDHTRLNYADLNEGNSAGDERIWGKLINVKTFKEDHFKRYQAHEVNMELLRSTGFREPFIVETNEPELEMKMPPNDITVKEIARLVGGDDYPVEVIDVASQSEIPGWTMGRWAEYFHNPERDRIRNVISLEISGSDLADQVTRPRIVREMDWIDQMWPTESHPDEFPRVQLYCLMGTKDSYTDFHIDFGGSSVFYHILSGYKTFYFIEPTPKNLKKYQKWSSSPDQSTTFLGDEVKECYSVKLKPGNTMLIPAGWIHAVYTPEDAIVIGGNFLQSFNVGAQIQVHKIEQDTEVPLKFRFPFYQRLNWYALLKFADWLTTNPDTYSYHEVESMAILAAHLKSNLKKNEKIANGSSIRKQFDIPEIISDPLALTRKVLGLAKNAVKQQKQTEEEKKPPQRIMIRMTATKKPEKESSYVDKGVDEDDDFIEDNEDTEDDVLSEDDDDYEIEYDEDHEDTFIQNKKKPEKKSRPRKRKAESNESSSEDDSMGTSRPSKLTSSLLSRRKRLIASTNTPQKSVKQRLLDRITGNKRH